MEVWIGRDGERHGPYKEVDVRQWLRSGQVSPDDLGWHEGMTDWAPLSTLFPDERAEASVAPPAPPVPPYTPATPYASNAGAVASLTDYAGFWKRVGSYIIDGIVLWVPNMILSSMLGADHAAETYTQAIHAANSDPQLMIQAMDTYMHALGPALFAQTLLSWLYFSLMESSSLQATLGKLALGIRVTDMEGKRISFLRATGRYFAKILSVLTFFVGFLMVAWTQRKQGLHDLIAQTLVLNGRAKDVAAQTQRTEQRDNSSFNA
ncbi:RDD family protein [Dyella sp. C11]|uniref:RDD family protein n=1 Tax=Dyella sp. C11 TaxID=2126991 RepID=UPI000D646998|nr:RDD family protein [Dyella sp. C11]